MKILLVNLCHDPLSEMEFVRPIAWILRRQGIDPYIKHYTSINLKDIYSMDRAIICGSALKDEKFLEDEWFRWLKDSNRPVLGIGSGFQAIAKAFGCGLFNKVKIGVFRVKLTRENKLVSEKVFYAYFLAKRAAKISKPLEALAKTGELDCIIKHESKDIYGCLFHPEVTKPEIILNFAFRV